MPQVLIIDDDELFRKLMVTQLKRLGIEATTASGSEEALQVLHDDPAPFGLIILDIAMPQVNGLEFAKIVRGDPQLAHLPLVAISARKGLEVDMQIKDAGIYRLITKPPEPQAIRDLCLEFGLLDGDQA